MKLHSISFSATSYVQQNPNLHGYGSDYVSIPMINPCLRNGLRILFFYFKESEEGEEGYKGIILGLEGRRKGI